MNNNGEFLNKHMRFFMESLMGKFIMHISKLLYNILALPSLKKYLIKTTPIQKIIPKIDHLFKLTCLFIDSKIHNIIKAVPNLFTENNGDAIKVLWETLSDILNPGKVTTGLYLPLLVEDEEDKGDYMYGYYRNKEIKPREAFKGKFINVYEKGNQPYISEKPILKKNIYIASRNSYRSWMASVKKRGHGTLIALKEGIKISSDGIVDPKDTADRALQTERGLAFVFGSMPQGETRETR